MGDIQDEIFDRLRSENLLLIKNNHMTAQEAKKLSNSIYEHSLHDRMTKIFELIEIECKCGYYAAQIVLNPDEKDELLRLGYDVQPFLPGGCGTDKQLITWR